MARAGEWTHGPAIPVGTTLRLTEQEFIGPVNHPSLRTKTQHYHLLPPERVQHVQIPPEIQVDPHPLKQQLPQSLSVSLSRDTDTTYSALGGIRYPQPHIPPMDPEGPNFTCHPNITVDNNWQRVLKLRERVKNLRLQIQEQRIVVRSKQEAKSDVDEQYIKMIRKRHVRYEGPLGNSSELVALEELWRNCQAARDAHGPAEYSLNVMEDRLENEEAKLSRAEEQLFHEITLPQNSPAPDSPNGDTSDQSSVDSEPKYEPLYEEYLRRLGNQDLLLESYGGLINEKNRLEEEQERRRHVGLELDGEDLEFLAKWTDTIEPVRKELDEVSKDVERLKKMCLAQGLVEGSGSLVQPPESHEEPSQNLNQSEKEPRQSKAPQSQHTTSNNNNEANSSPYISCRHDTSNNVNINSWLLDKLRSSSHEIALLASFVFHEARDIDGKTWQPEVLRLWTKDGACLEMPVYDQRLELTTSTGFRQKDRHKSD